MTTQPSTSPASNWQMPDIGVPFKDGPGRSSEDHRQWVQLVTRIHVIASENGWSKTEMAERIGMPISSFSGWYAGTYEGRFDRHNEKVANFLKVYDDLAETAQIIPSSPDFLPLRASRQIIDMMVAAQVTPALVMVTGEAGIGKTFTARHFAATRPHVHIATISPHTRTVHAMLMEIALSIGIRNFNPGLLVRSIGERLQRRGAGSLLIIDEAQNLIDEAVNQARHFVDNYGCGVAVLGNTETYNRFSTSAMEGSRYPQLRRRIFKRLKIDRPPKDDLTAFIAAWGIKDEDQVTFLTGVGLKPGALGQIDMTVKLAKIAAAGNQAALTLDDLQWAWKNRDVEGLA